MSLIREPGERAVPLSALAVRGVVAVVAALAITALLLGVGRAVLPVPSGFEPMQWRPVLVTTAAGAAGGAVTYGLLDRLTTRTDRVFLGLATVVLLGSFVPLVTDFLARVPGTVVAFVALLHVTVAVVTVATLVGWPPPDRAPG